MEWENGTLCNERIWMYVRQDQRLGWLVHVAISGYDQADTVLDIPNESTKEQAQDAALKVVRDHLSTTLESLKDM